MRLDPVRHDDWAAEGLVIRGAAKRYGAEQALADVDLTVRPGEVHALLGENGAGKSTLMKIIAGSVRPDTGQVCVGDRSVPPGDPLAARAAGIGIVYQELSLVPGLTVEENVLLGRWPSTRMGTVDWPALRRAARRQLVRVGLDERVGAVVARQLGMAERQLVEIAKALLGDVRVLLLDEPTSALSDPESRRLFQLVRGLTASGVAVVYVSHRLTEVADLASRFTVLKDGRRVATLDRADVTENRLAALMVGHPESAAASGAPDAGNGHAVAPAMKTALKARGLGRPPRLRPLDLEIGEGEVVCVFGLVGAGRTRLARCLFGLEPATQGTLELFGRRRQIKAPADAIAAGIGYVGEDRAMGIVPKLSVAHNITLASLDGVSRGPVVNRDAESELGRRYIDELAIRVRSPNQPAGTLSGGNQQKVVLGRLLCSGARLLVLDDPTRGVDVGAKEEVFRLVRALASDGVGVLYLTSEIKEARTLGDRLLVMSAGRIIRELDPVEREETIMAAAGGLHG